MKKLFVYMLAAAGVFASAAYADGYNPFYPVGGINKGTTVPQVYADGSTGTLAQIGQMADSSVQQTDANKPNGYAALDKSGHVTVPVVGSVAAAPANTAGDTVSSIADTAKSAQATASASVQANGGDASKTVVTPTGDTASHSLSDVAAQATGSVQKTTIGAANGVAPLDANKMMSAAVSGDSSSSPVLATSSTSPRKLSDRAADILNIKDFGARAC